MKLEKLVQVHSALNALGEIKLKPTPSFKLGTFLRKVKVEIQTFNKSRDAIMEIHTVEVPESTKGERKMKDEASEKLFREEVKELLDCEVTDNLIPPTINLEEALRDGATFQPSMIFQAVDYVVKLPAAVFDQAREVELSVMDANDLFSALSVLGSQDHTLAFGQRVLFNLHQLRVWGETWNEQFSALPENSQERREMADRPCKLNLLCYKLAELEKYELTAATYAGLGSIIEE